MKRALIVPAVVAGVMTVGTLVATSASAEAPWQSYVHSVNYAHAFPKGTSIARELHVGHEVCGVDVATAARYLHREGYTTAHAEVISYAGHWAFCMPNGHNPKK